MSRKRTVNEYKSDSDDSDYYPGKKLTDDNDVDNSACEKKSEKQSHSSKFRQKGAGLKKKRYTKDTVSDIISPLPLEIVTKIFNYCVWAEGFKAFIFKASKVCHAWNKLCHTILYSRLDLSLKHSHRFSADNVALEKSDLHSLMLNDLYHCLHISLAGQNLLHREDVALLLAKMPNLVSLNLRDSSCLSSDIIGKVIPKHCQNLKSIDISSNELFLRCNDLDPLIKSCGNHLLELRMAKCLNLNEEPENQSTNIEKMLSLLANHCPNLLELDVRQHDDFQYECIVDMDLFLQSCSNLQELRIDGLNLVNKKEGELPGLPHLKIYSQRRIPSEYTGSRIFYQMFSNTYHLTELRISHTDFKLTSITSTVRKVDKLHMSDMNWSAEDQLNLRLAIEKWGPSLVNLKISGNRFPSKIIDEAMFQFVKHEESSTEKPLLQKLDLTDTNITAMGVIHVLTACKNLELLNLTNCRKLPFGMPKMYPKTKLQSLKERLQSYQSNGQVFGSSDDESSESLEYRSDCTAFSSSDDEFSESDVSSENWQLSSDDESS